MPTGPEAREVEAFVGRYLAQLNKAIENGNVSTVSSMYSGGCMSCSQLVSSVRATYGKGGRFVGGIYTENKIDVYGESSGTYLVRVRSVATAWSQYDQSGKKVQDGPAEAVKYSYGVRKVNGRWQLVAGGKTS